ncbi:hypothetical protein TNCT_730921 [Trichonephila clavata]|uniref:Uncharacterized protein n=1 Tax=Trichonephila clavata TaxID=2740835 RepID=A0A8X6KA24_TRICU|nr:hypothetical protein TNCT_730921 [Trichonephila clavata]
MIHIIMFLAVLHCPSLERKKKASLGTYGKQGLCGSADNFVTEIPWYDIREHLHIISIMAMKGYKKVKNDTSTYTYTIIFPETFLFALDSRKISAC